MKVIEKYNRVDRPYPYHETMNELTSAHDAAQLVRECPNVNVVDESRHETLLMIACRKRFYDAIEILFSKGAGETVNHKSKVDGATALHNACYYNSRPLDGLTIQILLSKKADVNAKDFLGYTPLHWVMYSFKFHRKVELVKLLVDHGANANTISRNYETILHGFLPDRITYTEPYVEVMIYLLNNGLDPKLEQFQKYNKQKDLSMPLPISIILNNEPLLRKLVDQGLEINFNFRYDKYNRCNPLDFAYLQGAHISAVYLEKHYDFKMNVPKPVGTIIRILSHYHWDSVTELMEEALVTGIQALKQHVDSHKSVAFLVTNILYFHHKYDLLLHEEKDNEEQPDSQDVLEAERAVFTETMDTLMNSLSLIDSLCIVGSITMDRINSVIEAIENDETVTDIAIKRSTILSYMIMLLELGEVVEKFDDPDIRELVRDYDIFNLKFYGEDDVIFDPRVELKNMRPPEAEEEQATAESEVTGDNSDPDTEES